MQQKMRYLAVPAVAVALATAGMGVSTAQPTTQRAVPGQTAPTQAADWSYLGRTGRAMAVFTMAMFLGVALMQWVTGVAASLASARGADPYMAVMLTIAGMLATGAIAFRLLPGPPRAH